ncbi:Glyoxalase/Bleomycin resistance protein/Dihydroxybiphenyl dioxygenase [Tothia fuscella]|uniref:Glyoxalase/Bleomycin resistance protein/Dihydroxybiphenyl dioxygenase n=1 Tax=Tothia fuscella TaxID=1048955 RepID=A0A9P4U3A8_9PEZI|nr:Glyoxalase/Bleomycin resistance protein/Dihydroxybiphenyl dioxygenase [Tothia fuscella]
MLSLRYTIVPCACLVVLTLILVELLVSRPKLGVAKLHARHLVGTPNLQPFHYSRRKVRAAAPTKIHHVLETCLYIRNMDKSVKFYRDILGLQNFMDTPKLSGFAIGDTTLLLFHLGDTSADTNFTGVGTQPGRGQIAGHGPDANIVSALGLQNGTTISGGRGHPEVSLKLHFAFAVERREDVLLWEDYFKERDVHIHSTMDWDRGGRSVYFFDPDGHVGEVVSRGIWAHW